MTQHHTTLPVGLTVREDEGLVGIVVVENGHQATRFFTEPDGGSTDAGTQAALGAIGAWADLDWDEAVEFRDRIRHQNKLSPPLDL